MLLKFNLKPEQKLKKAPINIYGISGDKLETKKKVESEPESDNNFANDKAQNKRVEFIKI